MEIKRITLHPVLEDGTVDTNVNLYPKTLLRGIVDDTGEEVEIATVEYVQENSGTQLYRHTIKEITYYGPEEIFSFVSLSDAPLDFSNNVSVYYNDKNIIGFITNKVTNVRLIQKVAYVESDYTFNFYDFSNNAYSYALDRSNSIFDEVLKL